MLHVYKASAGSGKTYKLTYFYLKICFDHLHDPNYFQHILAMTFTNDATAEMKTRIIEELKLISKGSAASDHRDNLKDECGLSEEEVQEGARSILRAIMQHYTRFSISTIDSFFQKVLRVFTKELDVEGGYEIELDTDKVLDNAMSAFLSDLYTDSEHLVWIEMILRNRLDEEKNHDFTTDLLKLGKILFQEDLEQKISYRTNKDLQGIYRDIHARINEIEGHLTKNIEAAKAILEDYELDISDFKGGKTQSFPKKWFTKFTDLKKIEDKDIEKLADACDNLESWYKESDSEVLVAKMHSCYSKLNSLLRDLLQLVEKFKLEYLTLVEMRKNFPSFAFLSTLDQYVQSYCEQEQKMLLSRTTFLLKKVIDFQIIPFFYERIGHRYHHILLDEFQDTSGTQWENLKVLVDHAISEEGNNSLVVGDVKQAIYRWRNGDWRMLHMGIKNEYAPRELYKTEQLGFNWRSYQNIVKFNNRLFQFLPMAGRKYAEEYWHEDVEADYTPEMIEHVFQDHSQELHDAVMSDREGGFVRIDGWLANTKLKEENEQLKWDLLRRHIRSAIDRGYEKRDICILVRKVSEGTEIAEKLFEWQEEAVDGQKYYNCSSREVLQLSSSIAVQAIVAFFKLVADPDDNIALAEWHQAMESLQGKNPEYRHYAKQPEELEGVLKICQTQSLWEISDRVIKFAGLGKVSSQIPFLQHFQDSVLEFMQSEGGHIDEFIDWWEEKGYKSAVLLPEGQDAIRIITIHKSKGLEFPIVILPYVQWAASGLTETGRQSNWIWSEPFEILGERFDTFPVNFSKSLQHSLFQSEFHNELVQQVIDNLNLLYVASTRAMRELYLLLPDLKSIDGSKVKSVGDLLVGISADAFEFKLQNEEHQHYSYTLGDHTMANGEREVEDQLISLDTYRGAKSIPPLSGRFTRAGLEELESEALSRGRALHWIFEQIENKEDIEIALDQAVENGIIAERERETLFNNILELFAHDHIGPLLQAEGELLHERELMLQGGKLLRPDRVLIHNGSAKVIDFKTGEHYQKNEKQVKEYINALADMNYKNVSGYLLYLDRLELKKVD